jgi:hypothetical protein
MIIVSDSGLLIPLCCIARLFDSSMKRPDRVQWVSSLAFIVDSVRFS